MPNRILLVDDDGFAVAIMSTLLTRQGYDVTQASSPTRAMQALRTMSFDVLITDLNMPEGGGLELIRQARAERLIDLRQIIVITATGSADDPDIPSIEAQGIPIVSKVTGTAELNRTIESILGHH
jgi:CheY-like chemotaxis protein